MRFPSLLVAAAAVVAALLAGCTTEVAGTPSAPTGLLLPPRPREVRLDGVDPCSLLSPAQRAGLGITSEPHNSNSYVAPFGGNVATCTMHGSGPSSMILGIGTVITVGIERWRDPTLQADVRPTAVADFPAVVALPTQSRSYCSVEVDVASGQLLDVQALIGDEPALPQGDLCAGAQRSASEMMTTLLAR